MLRVPALRLVAVSIKSVLPTQFAPGFGSCTPYLLTAESFIAEAQFDFETAPMPRPHSDTFEALRQHGFTVVEAPDRWLAQFGTEQMWREQIIKDALRKVMEVNSLKDTSSLGTNYKTLSQIVLIALEAVFPQEMSTLELKQRLVIEPSDEELLSVLDGLHRQGFIDGYTKRERMSGQRKLAAMKGIIITNAGMKELEGKPAEQSQFIQQFNNYGQAGALGPQAVGTIINRQQWTELSHSVDLVKLSVELETLRVALLKSAKSPDDFQRLSLIAEAEDHAHKHDGPRVIEALSRSGKWLFDFATEVGSEITAKVIAKAMHLEP